MKEKNFVSCVVYLHNDAETVKAFLTEVNNVMRDNFDKYEIICVNDACTDATEEEINRFIREQEGKVVVSMIRMSYFQGAESAMNAGRDLAVGDFLFEFDKCELDFEPSLIMEVYRRSLEGFDVVAASPKYGVPLSSKIFYFIYNWGRKYSGKLQTESFRVISRRAVNRVNQLNVYIPYRKAMYMSCGLKADIKEYDNRSVSGAGRRNRKASRNEAGERRGLALDTIIIFTNVFEKLSFLVSGILLGALLIMLGYLVYSVFSEVRPVEGWLSTMFLISFGFFMVSVLLTMMFKYMSVILNMNFKKQHYVIEGVEKLTK